MKQFIKIMKALSDPNRVKIIKMLEVKELCVCEVQSILNLAQSTVSKHLKVLEDTELITYEKQGSWIIYRLSSNSIRKYNSTMLNHMRQWLNDESEIKELKKILPTAIRVPQKNNSTKIKDQ